MKHFDYYAVACICITAIILAFIAADCEKHASDNDAKIDVARTRTFEPSR